MRVRDSARAPPGVRAPSPATAAQRRPLVRSNGHFRLTRRRSPPCLPGTTRAFVASRPAWLPGNPSRAQHFAFQVPFCRCFERRSFGLEAGTSSGGPVTARRNARARLDARSWHRRRAGARPCPAAAGHDHRRCAPPLPTRHREAREDDRGASNRQPPSPAVVTIAPRSFRRKRRVARAVAPLAASGAVVSSVTRAPPRARGGTKKARAHRRAARGRSHTALT